MEDREFELKERELQLREREVVVKEREAKASRWLNPVVLGLFAAAAGLVGNMWVTSVNNRAAERTERVRAQSSLVQGVIKTADNDATCKNLIFFVKLGMLDDPQGAIRNVCPKTEEGVPSLPLSNPSNPAGISLPLSNPATLVTGVGFLVLDADSKKPIEGADVQTRSPIADFSPPVGSTILTGMPMGSAVTDEKGYASIGMMPSYASIVVSKSGYETTTTKLQPGLLAGTQVIHLHRIKPSSP